MSERHDVDEIAQAIFGGMTPTRRALPVEHHGPRIPRGVKATMPLVLAGAMTVSMNLTGPIEPGHAQPTKRPAKAPASSGPLASAAVAKVSEIAPASYRVAAGDTVSAIAGRYGLSTASVLALNGLGWKSLIFPGQVLKLTASAPVAAPDPAPAADGTARYTIVKGDTISAIAARHGASTQSVLALNGLGWSSIIYPGQTILIPVASPSAPPAVDDTPSIEVDEVSAVSPVTPTPPSADPPPAPPAPAPPTAPPPSAPEQPPAASNGSYTVVSGDTISAIAARHGVTTQALLTANGLSASSTIFPGQVLTIPGGETTAPAGVNITPMSSEMAANARIIVDVGRALGVPDRGIIIALATAMQESSLRNLTWGDRDSVGLFQQRPSTGWGTVADLTTPAHAARLFYGGPSNPNKGKTRGLLDISGWQSMTLTQAAQAVQISAYPNAYAKWEDSATAWLAQLS